MPTYRYKCEKCGNVKEYFTLSASRHTPPTVCHEKIGNNGEIWVDPIYCHGDMRRLYEDFQFHISGR